MNVKRVFGNNLKHHRKKAGLTQEQLSERLGISTNHLANLELGKKFVSAELLEKISGTLDVSFSTLFYTPELAESDESLLSKVEDTIDEYFTIIKKKIRGIE